MKNTPRKELRRVTQKWLEIADKEEYENLMDKLEAADLRNMLIIFSMNQYRGVEPRSDDPFFIKLTEYYAKPIQFQKEILIL